MSSMVHNVRAKLKRRLSHKEENPNFDEYESGDEDTQAHTTAEIEEAEKKGYDQGKPGSFLNKLIMHGNKKTEEQIAKENAAKQVGQSGTTESAGRQKDTVIR